MKKFTHVSDDVSKNDYTGSWIRVDITLSALHIQVKHKLAGFKKKKSYRKQKSPPYIPYLFIRRKRKDTLINGILHRLAGSTDTVQYSRMSYLHANDIYKF